jgi:hypothetical protein
MKLHLSQSQRVEATQKGDGPWKYHLTAGTPTLDPQELRGLLDGFSKKEESTGRTCEMDPHWHGRFLLVPLIDPDLSPEPLGVVRLIYALSTTETATGVPDAHTLIQETARLARGLARLLRHSLERHRLLRTLSELIRYTTARRKEPRPESLPHGIAATSSDASPHGSATTQTEASRHGIVAAGPYGREASSLLLLGEASVVSIFVRNDLAPRDYQVFPPEDESWVLVGAAADAGAISEDDQRQFRLYSKTYLEDGPGSCRYRADMGRTGTAIARRRTRRWEIDSGHEAERSEFLCEVHSPSALLIVPMVEEANRDSSRGVVAVVRFGRTEERRRAMFLEEEQDRLEIVVDALGGLVPARSRQDQYAEFEEAWGREVDRVFPPTLRKLLQAEIEIGPRSTRESGKPASEREKTDPNWRERAGRIEGWILRDDLYETGTKRPPDELSGPMTEETELQLLAWFLRRLGQPAHDVPVSDLVQKIIRGLLRIHWGPAAAGLWADSLERLGRFEPLLSEIPRYRDHSIHQFQVFLLGWILMRHLGRQGILSLKYTGWSTPDCQRAGEGAKTASGGETRTPGAGGGDGGGAADRCTEVLESAWVLASLYHDVAYPLELAFRWANVFGAMLTDVPGEYVTKGDARRFFGSQARAICQWDADGGETARDHERGVPRFDRPLDLLFTVLKNTLPVPAGRDAQEWSRELGRVVGQHILDWDHGLWAALVLLERSEPSRSIVSAALAIALHGRMLDFLKENEVEIRLGFREKDAEGPGTEREALSLILLVSDALHEWGRSRETETAHGDEESDLGRRPSLVRLSVRCDSEKEDCASGEASEAGRIEIDIDLAMGHDSRMVDLDRKIEELLVLRDILGSDAVSISIRVGRGDPTCLDPEAAVTRTVVLGASRAGAAFCPPEVLATRELAVVTLTFQRADGKALSEADRRRCQEEGIEAISKLLEEVELPPGARLTSRIVAEGPSSYWFDVAIEVACLCAAAPYVLHQLGELLEGAGSLAARLSVDMKVTGGWLKWMAARLTPGDSGSRIPRCFGVRELIDGRTTRCRGCDMLDKCRKRCAGK